MPNEAQLLAPGGHEVRQPDACLASRHRGGVWVAEGGVGTEPFRTLCPLSDPDYLLQTAPSASSALWLQLISLINGPTVLPEEELSVSFRDLLAPPAGPSG